MEKQPVTDEECKRGTCWNKDPVVVEYKEEQHTSISKCWLGSSSCRIRDSYLPSAFCICILAHICKPLHLKAGTRYLVRRPESSVSAQQFLPLSKKNLCPIELITSHSPFLTTAFLPFCCWSSLLTYMKNFWKNCCD